MYLESPIRTLKPTQSCHKCWKLTPKTLSDRIHDYQHCLEVCKRDVAAAINIRRQRACTHVGSSSLGRGDVSQNFGSAIAV